MNEFMDKVLVEVRLAVEDMAPHDAKKLSLDGMIIIACHLNPVCDIPSIIGEWKVFIGTIPTNLEYILAFEDPNAFQRKFLLSHENVVNEALYESGVR